MPISSVFNTWVNAKKETNESVDRCAALVRACHRNMSGVDSEGLALATAALESAESAAASLQAFANKYGYQ
jgi:hypothetical protein